MTGEHGFVFAGFLPSKATERQMAVQHLAQGDLGVRLNQFATTQVQAMLACSRDILCNY